MLIYTIPHSTILSPPKPDFIQINNASIFN